MGFCPLNPPKKRTFSDKRNYINPETIDRVLTNFIHECSTLNYCFPHKQCSLEGVTCLTKNIMANSLGNNEIISI